MNSNRFLTRMFFKKIKRDIEKVFSL